MKATPVGSVSKVSLIVRAALFAVALMCSWSAVAATPYPMSSGNYSEGFDDIANWGANFSSGIGASRWSAAPINTSGTVPDGVKITTNATATAGWPAAVSQSTGIQKGTGAMLFLTTGSTDHSAAIGAICFSILPASLPEL